MDLHEAAGRTDVEQVSALAAQADDVDELSEGRTPLWEAVFEGKPDNARMLVAAGADPHRPMMAGWSPARLAEDAHRILLGYLHRYDPVAYSCAVVGLRLTDARAITGPPDVWLRLPG